jgi:hypothetical protein
VTILAGVLCVDVVKLLLWCDGSYINVLIDGTNKQMKLNVKKKMKWNET